MTKDQSFLDQLGLDAERRVELTVWQRPGSVERRGGHLVGSRPGDEVSIGSNQTGLLAQFARLGDAEDDRIVAFAKTWGLLGLCEHGAPRTDRRHQHLLVPGRDACDPPEALTEHAATAEPIHGWRSLAGQVAGMLEIIDRIRRRQPASPDLWDSLRPLYPAGLQLPDDPGPSGRPVSSELLPELGLIGPMRLVIPTLLESRQALAYAIRQWIGYGDIRLRFDWRAPTPQLTFGGDSLLGALATLLAVAAGGAEGPLLCSHCRLPYTPTRRPRGKRHFCEDCRDAGVPQMYASRDYRARKSDSD